MSKSKVFSVFVPNDVPSITYVARPTPNNEQKLRDGLDTPKMVISISGPSKTGKTALVHSCVDPDSIILVSGASINSPDDVWKGVMKWIGGPDEITRIEGSEIGGELGFGAKIAGNALIAKGETGLSSGLSTRKSNQLASNFSPDYFESVVNEIGDSDFVVFLDDFHYIPREQQVEVAKSIKAIAERGVRVCVASVPYRSDDVVRANDELSGRLISIDFDYWSIRDLETIAKKGFSEMGVDIAPAIITRLAKESIGSPQLMQTLCLNLCLETNLREAMDLDERFKVSDTAIEMTCSPFSPRLYVSSVQGLVLF